MNAHEEEALQGLPKNLAKKPQQTSERQFQPFKSPFTEEIINTSKEVTSHKTNQENRSMGSGEQHDNM